MPHTFPSTAQSALIVGRTPGQQPTPPSARRSVDDADFIGEKRVQGDPRGPGGPPHNFGGIRSFGKKYAALANSAWRRPSSRRQRESIFWGGLPLCIRYAARVEYVGSTIEMEGPMAISTPDQPRDRRFQLRATASEETLIKVAAERQGVNLTEFIMRSARENAEQVLADQTRFVLDAQQWKAFMAVLDRPAKDKPRLRRLFNEPHIAKRRSGAPY